MITPLNELIQAQKQESFTDPSAASDADALGILISQHFEWDVIQVAKTAAAALEDSNWHSLASTIGEAIKALEAR
jgi:hypothetical protein